MKSAGPLVTRREPVIKQPSVTIFRLYLTPRDQQVQIADNIPTCTQSFKQRAGGAMVPLLFFTARRHLPCSSHGENTHRLISGQANGVDHFATDQI